MVLPENGMKGRSKGRRSVNSLVASVGLVALKHRFFSQPLSFF